MKMTKHAIRKFLESDEARWVRGIIEKEYANKMNAYRQDRDRTNTIEALDSLDKLKKEFSEKEMVDTDDQLE